MLVVVYHLLFCAHLGCIAVDSGRQYPTFASCLHARKHLTDVCAREDNFWVEPSKRPHQ